MLALMAFAPTQISIAHRAFIDGFFGLLTLLAIWSLWESLQQPKSRWCWMFGLSLGLLVLTKENAAFRFYTGMLVLIGASHWLKFGQVSGPAHCRRRGAARGDRYSGPLRGQRFGSRFCLLAERHHELRSALCPLQSGWALVPLSE